MDSDATNIQKYRTESWVGLYICSHMTNFCSHSGFFAVSKTNYHATNTFAEMIQPINSTVSHNWDLRNSNTLSEVAGIGDGLSDLLQALFFRSVPLSGMIEHRF